VKERYEAAAVAVVLPVVISSCHMDLFCWAHRTAEEEHQSLQIDCAFDQLIRHIALDGVPGPFVPSNATSFPLARL
jgi:hypothetical protein